MQDYRDQVVVVTGAGSGIGLALSRQFAAHGAQLVLAGRRKEPLDSAAASMRRDGAKVEAFVCDVSRLADVEALAEFAWGRFGRVDVIVNNAGIGPAATTVIDAPKDDVRQIFDVNFFGQWNGVSVFGKRFVEQGTPAAIFNLGSENSFFNAVPGGVGYIAAKHATLAMTLALREEVPEHIHVGLICPGLVKTALADVTRHGMDADQFAAAAMKLMLAGEFYVTTHSYNVVRVLDRHREIEDAYARNAPRYGGDSEFDVRILGAEMGWWTRDHIKTV